MHDRSRDTAKSLRELTAPLERLLASQLQRVRQRYLLHGTGWLVAALGLTIVVYYAVDRSLTLPPAVRVVVSIALALYLFDVVRRRLLYPLRRKLLRDDVAVAMERRFPELQERLISAMQLQDAVARSEATGAGELRNQSPAMIEKLVAEAAATSEEIPPAELLDSRKTLRVWGLSAAALLAVTVAGATNPEAFGVFFGRMFGAAEPYPRLTTLTLELPEGTDEYRIDRTGRRAVVTMAAGADLPVLVRAEGVVPREVFLMVEGGRGMPPRIAMTTRGPERFRHVFRRVSNEFTFHASGGDDPIGDIEVVVHTVRPPRVGTIRTTLTPPAYTGRDPITQAGGAFEALRGTAVEIQVVPTAEVRSAALTFLESGRELELVPQTVADDEGTRQVLIGRFEVEKSDRYQIQLNSPDGLSNPHPGTYPVVAVTDKAPTGRILTPTDDNLSVALPTAAIPLRLHARDDYGLVGASALVELSKNDATGRINLLEAAPEEGAERPRRTVFTRLLEVGALPVEGAAASVGDTITIGAELTDNCAPEPSQTVVPGRQVHVVGNADLARRVAGHFRRVRESVEALRDIQERLGERLQATLESDVEQLATGALTVVQVGQARVQSRSSRIHHEFMRAFNLHLFNRLDDSPHAERALELYVSYHQSNPEPTGFLPAFYSMLGTERREGRLGSMPKTLDPILEMTLSCARIADELAPEVIRILDEAAVAATGSDTGTALETAADLQQQILAELQRLEQRLEEWNEFQDVIIQTRSVLDKQREIQVRTRDSLRGDGSSEPRKR